MGLAEQNPSKRPHTWGPHKLGPHVDASTCTVCGFSATNVEISSGLYGQGLPDCPADPATIYIQDEKT